MLSTTKHKLADSLAGAGLDTTLPTDSLAARAADGSGPAVLFADVSRSMLLHEKLGDRHARVVIDRLLRLAAKAVKAHGGRVVKNIGDEILAVMPGADAAARAACDTLAAVAQLKPEGGVVPDMHVGFHAGSYTERGGNIFGDAVKVAAQLTAYAQSGQILTTRVTAAAISPLVRRAMRPLGTLDIRGRQEKVEIEEVAWRESDDEETTLSGAQLLAAQGAGTRLVLQLGTREWVVSSVSKHFSIGRDAAADIVVGSAQASRNHGFVEYRNGSYYYADTSLNGSYVSFGAAHETLVRRNEILLSGRGQICFGHAALEAGEPLVFRIDCTGH